MLDGLRGFAKSWPGKILGGFLLVGVAGFGINNVILDLGSNTIARVGDEEINSREFLRAYESRVSQLSQQLGSVPTASQAEAYGIPTAVLLNLSEGAALDTLSSQFGLGVSDAKLAQMLREDPSFFGTLGTFDPSIFTQTLQRAGWTEAEYFEARAAEARRTQVLSSLFAETGLPDAASDLLNKYSGATRTVDYITLTELNVDTPAAPTEEELAAYLTEHQAEFRTVETRTVRLLDLSLTSLAATKTFTDEEIAAEYEAVRESLSTPERRTIEQVALNTPELQAQFEAGLAAGADFTNLVQQAGLTPSSLGTLAQSAITDTALANAAFGLAQGDFALIPGIGGQRAIHVSAIEAAGQPTLEEARADIVARLGATAARNEINDILDQIEELRAAFTPIEDIAQRYGLEVYEVAVSQSGAELSALPNLAADERQKVAQAIYRAEEGRLTPSVPLAGNAHLWFDLESIAPARDQTLDEVRDQLIATITEERTNNALIELGNTIVGRLEGGEALTDVAAELSLFPQISPPFSRFGSDDGTIDTTVAAAAFAGGPDHKGSAVSESGEFIVFQVTDNAAPAEPLATDVVAGLNDDARTGLENEFVAAIRDDAGLRINQQALNTLLVNNYGQ
ncbi:peptidylprolyl isomerase [Devosia rhizoryzae]|uniref:Peptidylprolyl isomerase n=1 Tax=Devosia rhizoryzae TaxID=2774137 RepID=A0ABX7CBM0_9HYPH|nr:peptidylprolyl isomerase [Devosia rhizoryzae]QQR40584.1 peptidylprolyl isomerase [Devosia rhizoryzae]